MWGKDLKVKLRGDMLYDCSNSYNGHRKKLSLLCFILLLLTSSVHSHRIMFCFIPFSNTIYLLGIFTNINFIERVREKSIDNFCEKEMREREEKARCNNCNNKSWIKKRTVDCKIELKRWKEGSTNSIPFYHYTSWL